MNRSLLDDLPEPPLLGEEWVTALLLKMVVEHCATGKPYDLSSHGIAANEDAMHELNGAEIEITHETAQCIFANVTPEGRALLEKLRAELEATNRGGQVPISSRRCRLFLAATSTLNPSAPSRRKM